MNFGRTPKKDLNESPNEPSNKIPQQQNHNQLPMNHKLTPNEPQKYFPTSKYNPPTPKKNKKKQP